MKIEYFKKAVEKYHRPIERYLRRKGCDDQQAHDVTNETILSLLSNRAYKKLDYDAIDNRVHAFIKSAARKCLGNAMRKRSTEVGVFVQVEENINEHSYTESKRKHSDLIGKEKPEMECPYCHTGILNQYKACGECHTILGQGRRVREAETINEDELAYDPQTELRIDVADAMNQLEPLERKVIVAVVNQNETLAGFADENGMAYTSLCRVYVRAKRKLQLALLDYA